MYRIAPCAGVVWRSQGAVLENIESRTDKRQSRGRQERIREAFREVQENSHYCRAKPTSFIMRSPSSPVLAASETNNTYIALVGFYVSLSSADLTERP